MVEKLRLMKNWLEVAAINVIVFLGTVLAIWLIVFFIALALISAFYVAGALLKWIFG